MIETSNWHQVNERVKTEARITRAKNERFMRESGLTFEPHGSHAVKLNGVIFWPATGNWIEVTPRKTIRGKGFMEFMKHVNGKRHFSGEN